MQGLLALPFLLTLASAGMVRAQEVYSALLNIPGNAPTSLIVMVRGSQTAGWTTSATVKVPSGIASAPTRSVVFQLTADCAVGHVYGSPNGVPNLTASCWPIPAAVANPEWWGLSITLTDAERKAVAAAAKVGVAIEVKPTEYFVSTVLVAWPVP